MKVSSLSFVMLFNGSISKSRRTKSIRLKIQSLKIHSFSKSRRKKSRRSQNPVEKNPVVLKIPSEKIPSFSKSRRKKSLQSQNPVAQNPFINKIPLPKYSVSQQVLDGLIGYDNPIGLWWVWVAYPKTTIPYYDGCLPKPSGNSQFSKNQNNCYSP